MLASDYLLLGLDSAVVGVAVAPLLGRRRNHIMLALACGVADGIGSALGTSIGRPWGGPGETLPAVLLVLYGVIVLVGISYLRFAARHRSDPGPRNLPGLRAGTCLALPVLLSIDNLIYPTPGLGAGATIGLAASSAALMVLGLSVGSLMSRRWVPISDRGVPDLWAGAGLLIAGLVVVVA